jgi:hypothetical protein
MSDAFVGCRSAPLRHSPCKVNLLQSTRLHILL